MSDYVYDMSWEQERQRLAGIEAALDPGTIDVFRRLGVGIDWRCLEVGAGGGSIAAWLADRGESVVATDLDTRFLDRIGASNLEVRVHNVVTDDLEAGVYDLAHARMLLEHLPSRDDVLHKLIDALRPGGWLFIEDVDFSAAEAGLSMPAYPARATALLEKATRKIIGLMIGHGYDPGYARRLPAALREAGLIDVEGEMQSRLVYGASPEAAFARLSIAQLGPLIVEAGEMTAAEFDELTSLAGAPTTSWMEFPIVRAWGRKPE